MRISTKIWTSVNTKSVLGTIVVAMAVAAFALTGVGRFNRGVDQNTAAEVGSTRINMQELNNELYRLNQESGKNLNQEQFQSNIENSLNKLINQRIFIEEASEIGWSSHDLEVVSYIRKIPTFHKKGTTEFDYKTYDKFVKSGQVSALEMETQSREKLNEQKIRVLLELALPQPKVLLKDMYALNNTSFELEYAEISPQNELLQKEIASEAKKYALDPANDKKLNEEFERNKQDFSHKAQQRIKTALIAFGQSERASGEAKDRTEDSAKAIAEQLLKEIDNDKEFAKLSSQFNDDLKAKMNNGDLGWVDGDNIDPQSYEVISKLTVEKPLSEVVKTKFGFRIFKLLETRPAVNQTFEQVKEILATRIVESKVKDKLVQEMLVKSNEVLKDPIKLSAFLDKENIQWKKLKAPYTVQTKYIDDLGAATPLLSEVFKLKTPGQISQNILDFSGKKVLFKLILRKEAKQPEEKDLQDLAKSESYYFAQSFQTKSLQKLYEVYSREKKIRRNTELFNR